MTCCYLLEGLLSFEDELVRRLTQGHGRSSLVDGPLVSCVDYVKWWPYGQSNVVQRSIQYTQLQIK